MDIPDVTLFGISIVRFVLDLGILWGPLLVVSLTLNLEAGYAGVPNFGKVMFVAGGAAIAGSVSGRLAALMLGIDTRGNYVGNVASIVSQANVGIANNPALTLQLFSIGVILAAAVGAGLGLIASYPAIRLREDYLGMLLLGAAQLFQIFLGSYDPFIGGSQPIGVPDLFWWAPSGAGWRDLAALGIISSLACVVYLLSEKIARSPLGRTLRAVRDNEIAARSLGKDDVAIRRKVIVLASAISGIAGAMITFYYASVGAGTWDRIAYTFWPWVMVIIGGAANNLGVAMGSFSFAFALKGLNLVKFQFASIFPVDVNYLEYLLFASVLILILMFRPQGMVPEKSSLTLPPSEVGLIMQQGAVPVSPLDKDGRPLDNAKDPAN